MKKLILLLLLLPINLFAYEVNEYKGIKVTHDTGACGNDLFSACYFYAGEREGTINIEKFLVEDDYNHMLEHEYAHHLYFKVLTDRERAIWDIIVDEEKMTALLAGKGIDMTVRYAGWYATTHKYEDFAESYSKKYNGELKTYKDVKQFFTRYLVNEM